MTLYKILRQSQTVTSVKNRLCQIADWAIAGLSVPDLELQPSYDIAKTANIYPAVSLWSQQSSSDELYDHLNISMSWVLWHLDIAELRLK